MPKQLPPGSYYGGLAGIECTVGDDGKTTLKMLFEVHVDEDERVYLELTDEIQTSDDSPVDFLTEDEFDAAYVEADVAGDE